MTPATTELPTILYVEDDEGNIEVAELRLSRKFKLLIARDDKTACEIFRREGPKLRAVLMDIELKGSQLDGLQLTQLIKGKLPAEQQPAYARDLVGVPAPVFVVTAFVGQYPMPVLLEAGAEAFFPKPVDFVKLSLALANASARAVIKGLSASPPQR